MLDSFDVPKPVVTPLAERDPKEGLLMSEPVRMHEWADGMELPRWLSTERKHPTWWRRLFWLQDSEPMPDDHDRLHVIGILEKDIYGEVISSTVRDHLERCWYDPRVTEWVPM